MVLALPTSTTTTITSARLGTRQASNSNRSNNNNSHGNGNNIIIPPDNTSISRIALPPYQVVASSTRELSPQAMLSQFDKRDNSEDQKQGSSDMSPGEILGSVIAALTLLVAMIPLFRCSRFRHWVSSSISLAIKNTTQEAPDIKLPNPESATPEDPGANPVPTPHSIHIHNKHSDAQLVSASSDVFLCSGDGIKGGGGGKVPHVGESLPPRRPERTVTYPLPLGRAMPGPVGCSVRVE